MNNLDQINKEAEATIPKQGDITRELKSMGMLVTALEESINLLLERLSPALSKGLEAKGECPEETTSLCQISEQMRDHRNKIERVVTSIEQTMRIREL